MEDISLHEALPLSGNIFQSIIDCLGVGIQSDERVRMIFDSPVLNFPISLPFMKMEDLTAERLFDRIQTVLTSYQFIRFDETATMHFVHMKCQKGRRSNTHARLLKQEELLALKRSIVKIRDDGTNTCLARAIAIGQALQEKTGNELKYILKNRGKYVEPIVSALHRRAGITEGTLGGIEELQRFQDVLQNYRLVVLSREHCYSCIFKGPEKPRTIYLHLARGHYDVIRSMSGFLNRSNFCDECQKGYNGPKPNHVCNISCKLCYANGCRTGDIDTWVHCSNCNRNFKDPVCYSNHKTRLIGDKTVCQLYFIKKSYPFMVHPLLPVPRSYRNLGVIPG